ncbi:MAG TPA: methyltransferase domain-containing protein, partial [Puia sp.]|nr:methyltransferase domain-containing protein [Puia sp.]
MDFSARSNELELLDRNDIPFDAIRQNMHELDVINTYLGGHRITINGFSRLAGDQRRISVCEIGCGGGDNLMAIQKFCLSKNIQVDCSGIDINQECIEVARSRKWNSPTEFFVSDYRAFIFEKKKPDIVFSSLFCHHFKDEEIVEMLRWMGSNSNAGFFI